MTEETPSWSNFRHLKQRADECRVNGEFVEAGTNYTLLGYSQLGASDFELTTFFEGLTDLLYAGLSYRLADRGERCRNRCMQGELIARDHGENPSQGRSALGLRYEEEATVGLAHEFIGDFRVLGGLGGHDSAYAEALESYETIESELAIDGIIGWATEGGFDASIQFLIRLVEASEYGIDEEMREDIQVRSLTKRIEYKQEHFREILDQLIERGEWIWEEEQ